MLMRRNEFPILLRSTANRPQRLSNWLDEVFDDAFNWSAEGSFVPELNVYETDTMLEVTLELPGMSKEDIEISLHDGVLTVSGERKSPHSEEENDRQYHRVESRFGTFSRSLPVPNTVDQENVTATYENGVLAISIPKLEEKAGRKIQVS